MSKCVIHHMNADSFFLFANKCHRPTNTIITKKINPQPHTNNAESRNISNRSSSVIYVPTFSHFHVRINRSIYIFLFRQMKYGFLCLIFRFLYPTVCEYILRKSLDAFFLFCLFLLIASCSLIVLNIKGIQQVPIWVCNVSAIFK